MLRLFGTSDCDVRVLLQALAPVRVRLAVFVLARRHVQRVPTRRILRSDAILTFGFFVERNALWPSGELDLPGGLSPRIFVRSIYHGWRLL